MTNPEPSLKRQVERLYTLSVYGRWLFVAACWLSLGSFGIWGLRGEIYLWEEYFTWAAVRYGLVYNRVPTFCLVFCIAITVAVLVWQSQTILRGISAREKQRLEKQVEKIRDSGPTHPLWKWIIENNSR